MVSGVCCWPSSVSLFSSDASAAILGSSAGGSPSPQNTPPATRSTAPPTRIEQAISTPATQSDPAVAPASSIQPLPR